MVKKINRFAPANIRMLWKNSTRKRKHTCATANASCKFLLSCTRMP